jgi:two-component system, OmpR family, sensor histidine kinase MprB
MNLRVRIALSLATVAAAVGGLAAVGAYAATAQQIRRGIDDSLISRGLDLANMGYDDKGQRRPEDHQAGCPPVGLFQSANGAQLATADGHKQSCVAGGPVLPFTAEDRTATRTAPHLRTVNIDGADYRMMTTPWHEGGYIQLVRPLGEGHEVLENLIGRLAILTGLGTLLAAGLGWLMAKRVVRPIMRLRDTAETIATTQDLSTVIPPVGSGEVGSLAKSFTTMVDALAGSREQQKRLITDASHEMRTPLTSLRTNVELLDHFEQLSSTDRSETLAAVQMDAMELTHLLTELVELATDQSANTETPEPVRLVDLATDVVARASRRSGRQILVHHDDADVVITGRPAMLERAISNLVENAVKYSPSDTPIDVLVDGRRVEVRDHGPGITEADQPLVFDRFYRATVTRTEPGSGLGLAIVKQIVERHAGEVWAKNHPDGGALVGFSVPS